MFKVGMEDGSFIPPNSPALTLEFLKAGDVAPVSESGEVISLTTARGMEEPMSANNNEEVSRYGVLFVCFLCGCFGDRIYCHDGVSIKEASTSSIQGW